MRDGRITEKQIDDSARRILEIKSQLGLFADPYRHCDPQREARLLCAKDHLETARQLACESCVLLKNASHLLPLKAGASVAVIGPLADSKRDLLGSWKAEGEWDGIDTVLGGIKRNNTNGLVSFTAGCDVASTNRAGFAAALKAVRRADVAVLVLGESWNMSGEAKCRTSINLPGVQTELLREIKKTGKPVVLVLMNGRPLALQEESQLADAILEAWFPGTEGGQAVADILFGKENPSGKLPVTFPRTLGQVPIYYSVKNTGRPFDPAKPGEEYKSTYIDCPNDPLYPFGFGLSYSEFGFSDLHLDGQTLTPGGQLKASVTVTNNSRFDGAEVAQLYVRGMVGSVTRPVLELKGFQKVALKAGESRDVSFTITEKDLAFLRADMSWGVEPGEYRIFIGPNSRDLHSAKFQLSTR